MTEIKIYPDPIDKKLAGITSHFDGLSATTIQEIIGSLNPTIEVIDQSPSRFTTKYSIIETKNVQPQSRACISASTHWITFHARHKAADSDIVRGIKCMWQRAHHPLRSDMAYQIKNIDLCPLPHERNLKGDELTFNIGEKEWTAWDAYANRLVMRNQEISSGNGDFDSLFSFELKPDESNVHILQAHSDGNFIQHSFAIPVPEWVFAKQP